MNIYETYYGKNLRALAGEVTKQLKTYIAMNDENLKQSEVGNVYYLSIEDENVIQWNFPIVIDGKAYVDLRPYLTKQGTVRNPQDVSAAIRRAQLELLWLEDRDDFENIMIGTATIFGTWIASLLAFSHSLSGRDKVVIEIALTAYYAVLFMDEEKLDDRDVEKIFVQLARSSNVGRQILDDVFETKGSGSYTLTEALLDRSIEPLGPVLNWINNVIDVEIEGLSPKLLFNKVVNGSWVGALAPELASASLYHPPIFISLLDRAMTYSFFERTAIGRSVKNNSRNRAVRNLEPWLKRALEYQE